MPQFDKTKPPGSRKLRLSDDEIRDNWDAIQDAISREHQFPTIYESTAGKHLLGKTGVLFIGSTAEINALSGMPAGALALDTTLKVLKYYSGSAWVIVDFDHGYSSGKEDDDHPEYLRLTKEGQTLTQDLAVASGKKIDGVDISARCAELSGLKFLVTPVNKINWTAATDWTDVDISSDTGSDTAKAALLAVELDFDATASGSSSEPPTENAMTGLARKNGSSETTNLPKIKGSCSRNTFYTQIPNAPARAGCMWIVECDGSEIFEVKLQTDSGTPNYITFKVNLIGYLV